MSNPDLPAAYTPIPFARWRKNNSDLPDTDCIDCEGKGKIKCAACNGYGEDDTLTTCRRCAGRGKFNCNLCNGTASALYLLYKVQVTTDLTWYASRLAS